MEGSTKKVKARDEFRPFAERLMGRSLDAATDKQRSYALLRFYVEEIHNKFQAEISPEDIEDGLVDNSGDLGVDFICRDDGQVLMIQTKFRGQGKNESAGEISFFQDVFRRLLSGKMKPNQKLADILASIDFQNDSFRLAFVTFGQIQGQADEQTRIPIQYPDTYDNLSERCDWEYLDERRLDDELRNARSITASIPQFECELVAAGKKGARPEAMEISDGTQRSCVVVVDAMQLVNLYHRYRDGLFNLNIRNYIGNTRTNNKIVDTAIHSPGSFFYFNNGVSCVARSINVSGSKVKAEGLQIINGAQTVKALARAAAQFGAGKQPWPERQPQLLVRITEVGQSYGGEGRFLEDVTRFNNTQNVIKASDFRSNDPIQLDLQRRFAEIKRFGKQVAYLPKRTDKRLANTEIIRLEEFAKVMFAFLVDPISFSGSTSFLFDDSQKGGYVQVFGDGKQIWEAMPQDQFKLRAAVWWLADEFAQRIAIDRENEQDTERRAALERKWMILFVAHQLLERSFQHSYCDLLAKYYTGDWHLEEKAAGKWFSVLYKYSKQTVQYVYKEAAAKPGFVHRNWMRSASTVQALATFASTAPGIDLDPLT